MKSLQDQINFYNNYWSEFSHFGNYKIYRIINILEILVLVKKKIGKAPEILDLGCGDARTVAIWNEIGPSTGLDLSVEAIENAKKRYPFLNLYSGNATKTAFEDKSFDVVISQEVIEHIEEQITYIRECHRLLRENGCLILTTPNKYYFDRRKGGNYSRQPIENIVTPRELKHLVSQYFTVIELRSGTIAEGHYGIYKFISNRYISVIIKRLNLNRILERCNFGLQLYLFAVKK